MILEFYNNKLQCIKNGKITFTKQIYGDFIYNDNYILTINKKKNRVDLFDCNGKIIASLFNNNKIYILSILKKDNELLIKTMVKNNNKLEYQIFSYQDGYFKIK